MAKLFNSNPNIRNEASVGNGESQAGEREGGDTTLHQVVIHRRMSALCQKGAFKEKSNYNDNTVI